MSTFLIINFPYDYNNITITAVFQLLEIVTKTVSIVSIKFII